MRYPLHRSIVITNPFGKAGATQWYSFHDGDDLRASYENVVAPEGGYIADKYYSDKGGNTIILRGQTGFHYFHHLSKFAVILGQRISEGQTIAVSGNSGKWTNSAHLHWGLKVNNSWVDPSKYVGQQKGAEMNQQEKQEIADRFNSIDNSLKVLIKKDTEREAQINKVERNIASVLQSILKK